MGARLPATRSHDCCGAIASQQGGAVSHCPEVHPPDRVPRMRRALSNNRVITFQILTGVRACHGKKRYYR